ncbi:MAG: type III-B CRISPR module-associated protein Cmr5 [Byssovorax sp.]
MRSLERHKLAYKIASEWKGRDEKKFKVIVQLAQSYPIELRSVGIMQTIAFSLGKGDEGHTALASAIATWLLSPESGEPLKKVKTSTGKESQESLNESARTPHNLLPLLANADQAEYIAADAEAIAFADTIKTISKALKKAKEAPAPSGVKP